jgi:hypothetical protein
MNRRKTVLVLSICLNFILVSYLLIHQVLFAKVGPVEVGIQFKEAARTNNIKINSPYIADGREHQLSEQVLNQVYQRMSSATSFQTYELLKFSNGEMVLLNLTSDHKIQEVVLVPEESRKLFKD